MNVSKTTRAALLSLLAAANFAAAAAFGKVLNSPPAWQLWFGCGALVSGLVFWWQSRSRETLVWNPLRSGLAGMACALWGLYLLLFSRGLTYWLLDIIFSILALLFWLGRSRPVFLVSGIGIFAAIFIRGLGNDFAMILLDLLFLGLALNGLGRWAAARAARRAERLPGPLPRRRGLRAAIALGVFALLAVYVGRPVMYMVNPAARHGHLLALTPAFPVSSPSGLSPLAASLRSHVTELAGGIGERSAYQAAAQDKARDYIVAKFREAGYSPQLLEYSAQRSNAAGRTSPYYNVEVRLPAAGNDAGKEVWVLGAHYDTAPGTPGADDNTSGVAILLEAARLLRAEVPAREIRFVAFSTEEPPSFTTRDMGSFRYMRYLKDGGVKVYGLLNLEMLGYFNPRPGAQLYPPLMNLLHPDTGDFVSLSSNMSSLGLMRSVARSWRASSSMPIEPVFLPSVLSALFISDHLNFWFSGERALMLCDTAYFRNPYYHQDGDTPDKLDYERMAEVTRAVTAVLKAE